MVVQADSGDASLFLSHTRFWPYGVALIECLQRAVSSIATMSKKYYIYIYVCMICQFDGLCKTGDAAGEKIPCRSDWTKSCLLGYRQIPVL